MEEWQKRVSKKFGDDIIKKLGDLPQKFDVIPTGSLMLDRALGIGGWPRHYVSTIWGAENAGKTTLMYCSAAEALRMGGSALFIDMEKKSSAEWIRKNVEAIGVNTDNLFISSPETGSAAVDLLESAVKENVFDIAVVDSAYMLVTEAERDSEASDQHVGQLARFMSTNLKRTIGHIGASKTAVLFTNQLRYKIGVPQWVNPETMPGGQALLQNSIIIVRLKHVKQIKEGNKAIGALIRANIEKNQAAAPFTSAEWNILFDVGLDRLSDISMAAVELDVVEKGGAWYSFGENKWQGKEAFLDAVKEDSGLEASIRKAVAEAIKV
jgi:recombination protein RecA